MSSSSAARNRSSAAPPGSIQSCRRRNPSSSSRDSNRRGERSSRSTDGVAAARAQQLDELGEGRQRDPRLAVDRRPADVGDRGRLALHEHRDAQTTGRRLHRIEERPDGLDVVSDMGDQRDIGLERVGSAGGQRASTGRTLSMPCSAAISRRASSIDADGSTAITRRRTAPAPARAAARSGPRRHRCPASARPAGRAGGARPGPVRRFASDRPGTGR